MDGRNVILYEHGCPRCKVLKANLDQKNIQYEDIKLVDNILVNFCLFLAIFLRRWYLYSAVCLYLSYLIKWLFYKNKKPINLLKLLSSGIILLIVILL